MVSPKVRQVIVWTPIPAVHCGEEKPSAAANVQRHLIADHELSRVMLVMTEAWWCLSKQFSSRKERGNDANWKILTFSPLIKEMQAELVLDYKFRKCYVYKVNATYMTYVIQIVSTFITHILV
jgi:hypothetical protein